MGEARRRAALRSAAGRIMDADNPTACARCDGSGYVQLDRGCGVWEDRECPDCAGPAPETRQAGGMVEDPAERAWFDRRAKEHGGPLRYMAAALSAYSQGLPEGGLAKALAILSNEAAKAADRAREPPLP